MKRLLYLIITLFLGQTVKFAQKHKPHIVFVIDDGEYHSEEYMPMLGQILHRELGAKISLWYPLNEQGIVNPNINNFISGLEALKTADLMVVFSRWRELPTE